MLSLGQGCIRIFIARDAANAHPGAVPGFIDTGWTIDALHWKPMINPRSTTWVSGPTAMRTQITGTRLMLPIIYPLTLSLVLTAIAWRATRRTALTGCCQACGYNLDGLRDRRCPECGSLLARFLRRWLSALACGHRHTHPDPLR